MAEEGESSRRQAGATGNDDVEESDEDSEEDSDEDDDESMDEDNMSDSPAKTEDPERMDTDDDRRNHSKK